VCCSELQCVAAVVSIIEAFPFRDPCNSGRSAFFYKKKQKKADRPELQVFLFYLCRYSIFAVSFSVLQLTLRLQKPFPLGTLATQVDLLSVFVQV